MNKGSALTDTILIIIIGLAVLFFVYVAFIQPAIKAGTGILGGLG
ncbi:MAG TPA: hypothetical protein VJB87_01945 [Candidatus Nanoarchaeia archaeon]|nr:hypothetical protein [Candidatus Nanoarchaeia archaeon]